MSAICIQLLNLYLTKIFHTLWFFLLYLLYLEFSVVVVKIWKKKCHFFRFSDAGDNSHPCKFGTEGWTFQFSHIVLLSTTW